MMMVVVVVVVVMMMTTTVKIMIFMTTMMMLFWDLRTCSTRSPWKAGDEPRRTSHHASHGVEAGPNGR